jgi:SAM-dependent methyltransferase
MKFYHDMLAALLKDGRVAPSDSVLVVCGGREDRDKLFELKFTDVVISNLQDTMSEGIAPYRWEHVDAENIPHPDNSFDVVAVHAGLHHCQSPHRGMTEMFRVARKAIVVVESRDSLLMRCAKAVKFVPDYEIEALVGVGIYGGMRGGPIPNFIYRWTEAEVRKTLASFDPAHPTQVRFFHGLLLPESRFRGSKGWLMRALFYVLSPFAILAWRLAPGQGNRFGWIAWKSDALQPWLIPTENGPVVDETYARVHQLQCRRPAA